MSTVTCRRVRVQRIDDDSAGDDVNRPRASEDMAQPRDELERSVRRVDLPLPASDGQVIAGMAIDDRGIV